MAKRLVEQAKSLRQSTCLEKSLGTSYAVPGRRRYSSFLRDRDIRRQQGATSCFFPRRQLSQHQCGSIWGHVQIRHSFQKRHFFGLPDFGLQGRGLLAERRPRPYRVQTYCARSHCEDLCEILSWVLAGHRREHEMANRVRPGHSQRWLAGYMHASRVWRVRSGLGESIRRLALSDRYMRGNTATQVIVVNGGRSLTTACRSIDNDADSL